MARTGAKSRGLMEDNSDEPDLIRSAFMKSGTRAQSVPPKPRNVFGANSKSATKESGAMDEEQFREAFNEYTTMTISSGHEVETELVKISAALSNPSEDWEKRIEQLRRLRGLVVAGAAAYKEFFAAFRFMDISLQFCVKDLRSQVVRESCVTIAFLAEALESKVERTVEMNLLGLILLIPNSVKVMASSGLVCIRMILAHVYCHKFVPIIMSQYLNSKSKEIRRACCEFMLLFLTKFPKPALEKHVVVIQDGIKKGMADADSDARSLARQAYFAFAGHFPTQASALYKDLDIAKQRILDDNLPRSDSQSSLKSIGSGLPVRQTPAAQKPKKLENNLGVACALRIGQDQVESSGVKSLRSTSAIDPAAARRAKAKVPPATVSRTLHPPTRNVAGPPLTRGRVPPTQTYTRSQPGSRSSSPSNARFNVTAKKTPQTGNPSRDSSRDPSPGGRFGSRNQSAYKSMINRSGANPALGRSVVEDVSSFRKESREGIRFHSDDESDESGSEHSGFNRSRAAGTALRDNLAEILPQLSSGNWTTKRDGLLALQRYMVRDGKSLSHSELEQVSSLFTRMMNDPTTKVIGLFLDTLYDFVRIYKLELGPWLYMVMTKLLSKQGAELVPTVQSKIERLFELIRSAFPTDMQFQHLIRYITDQTQTPNVRVKAGVLNYLITLVQINMKPGDLRNSSSSRLGITRIINWSMDGKTPEIRKNSQQVLMALKQLNEIEFNALLDTLDEFLRDSALKLINGYPRRPSGLLEELPRVPVVTTTPQRGLPSSAKPTTSVSRQARQQLLVSPSSSPQTSTGNEENLNPDRMLRSLRQSSQETQKYGLASFDSSSGSRRPFPARHGADAPPSLSGSNDISPEYSDHSVVPVYAAPPEQILYLTTLAERLAAVPDEKKYTVLRHLNAYLPLISEDVWEEHLTTVLPFLFENLQNPRSDCVPWALSCFAQLLRNQSERMRHNPELTLVSLIEVQKNASKVVIKAAEDCAFIAAQIFPCAVSTKVLVPIMNNQPHPENAAAVRLFNFVVQRASKEDIIPILPLVMPSLLTGFADNRESNMRKECVYALIYTQMKVGEEVMADYVQQLPPSKVRLMKLYFKRTVESGEKEDAADGSANTSTDTPI